MAIEQGQCTNFKVNLLKGLENFNAGTPYTYKIALYNANATLNASTTQYTATNEISGIGYTAGGAILVPTTPQSADNIAYQSFADVVWSGASFTARGALIYNATTNAAVAVLDFGADKTATTEFTVTFPAATPTTAVIRII